MNAQKADLANLIATANNIANDAKSTFGHLTPAQLNWKPSADRWSVAQCFDHLLRLIVVHEQRHFQQAKRVMDENAFPA